MLLRIFFSFAIRWYYLAALFLRELDLRRGDRGEQLDLMNALIWAL